MTVQSSPQKMDVVPFVGVLLALLVTIISTAPAKTSSTRLDLPPAIVCDCVPQPTNITVTVSEFGLSVDDHGTTLAALQADICRQLGSDSCVGARVTVRADAETPYGRVADTVAQLGKEGFKINLLNEDIA